MSCSTTTTECSPASDSSSSRGALGLLRRSCRPPARRPAAASAPAASSMPISSHCFWPWRDRPARRAAIWPAGRWSPAARRSASRSRPVAPGEQGRRRRRAGPASASTMLSATVWFSNTVGFWNFRPMPASAISGSSSVRRSSVPSEPGGAAVRPGLAGDDVHHGRLAGAVRADDRSAARPGSMSSVRSLQRLEAVEADGRSSR